MSLEVLLPYLAGVVAPFVIQAFKSLFKLSGKPAMVLTLVVSVLLGIGAAFLSGEVTLADFTVEGALVAVAKVLAVATALYKLVKKEA